MAIVQISLQSNQRQSKREQSIRLQSKQGWTVAVCLQFSVTPRSLFFRLSQNKARRDNATCPLTHRSPSLTPACLFSRGLQSLIFFPAHKSLVTSDPINVVIGWQDGEKKDELAAVARATRSSMEKLKLNFANFGWCYSLSTYSIRKQFTPFWGSM